MQARGGEWAGSWVESERPCAAPAGSLLTPASGRPGCENQSTALPFPPPRRPACARVAVRLPCDTQALSWLQWQPPQGSQWILGHTPRPCEDPSKTQTPVSADLFLPDAPGLVPSSALHFRGLAGHESPSQPPGSMSQARSPEAFTVGLSSGSAPLLASPKAVPGVPPARRLPGNLKQMRTGGTWAGWGAAEASGVCGRGRQKQASDLALSSSSREPSLTDPGHRASSDS